MTTITQISANKQNSQKSTGPTTKEGKHIVANIALKHGIFSNRLILSDEDHSEYQVLIDGLNTELKPVGILEEALVERIAITLWRQKRLIRSENAHIELARRASDIVYGVNETLNYNYSSDNRLKEDELTEFDQDHYKWCQSVIREYEEMDPKKLTDMKVLKKQAPLIFQQLYEDAESDQQTIENYLNEWDLPMDYFIDLIKYCRLQIQKAEQRPLVLELAAQVQSKKVILQGKLRDTLSKYQIMLDNELYKAIKALREKQSWRLEILEPTTEENGFVLEKSKPSISSK